MAHYQSGKAVEVPISGFAPDSDLATKGILLDTQNAIPTSRGYQCMNSPVPLFSNALPETPIGSSVVWHSTQGPQHWAGGVNHLYRPTGISSGFWEQADAQGAASFGAKSWQFAQFEDDVLAVGGGSVPPQVAVYPLGTMQNLGGGAPAGASLVLAVNSQVMMFVGNTWYVSAIGADNDWAPSIQTQSGSAPLLDSPGVVVEAARLYRNVVAFKNNAIWFGSYVGGSAIWSWQMISSWNGTWGAGCAIELPDSVAFLGLDDFYYTTGYTPQRLPNQLKEWFFDTADQTQLVATQSAYDAYHAVAFWFFVSKAATTRYPDQFVAFNTRSQLWARGYLSTPSVPSPNTPDSLIHLRYFDSSNNLQVLQGPPGAARYVTGFYGVPGKLSQAMRVRPKYSVHPQTQTLRAYHASSLGQLARTGPVGVLSNDGWFNLRQTARYHQIELSTVGSVVPADPRLDSGAEVTAFTFEFREAGDR